MNENLKRVLTEVPWGAWVFLVTQGTIALVWGVRIDGRIGVIEQTTLEIRSSTRINDSEYRLLQNKVAIIEERQNRVVETNNYQQRQLDYIIQWFTPHVNPPTQTPRPNRPTPP